MRSLFYLPVVTPWWFEHVVAPLIRVMARDGEVSVLAPAPWRNTGVGAEQLALLADCGAIHWCLVDSANHPTLRTDPADAAGLAEFVASLRPDHIFARSADVASLAAFGDRLRFLMEASGAPFALPPHWVALQRQPFDFGLVPELPETQWRSLENAIATAWTALEARHEPTRTNRERVLAALGVPDDRPFLLLPLEYEHEENFFLMHRVGATPNAALIAEVAAAIPADHRLVVTDHPLNRLHLDTSAVCARVAELGDRVILAEDALDGIGPTAALAPHATAMLLGDSKSISLAAFVGTPLMRRTRFRSADWLNAASGFDALSEPLRAPDPAMARRWFAWHLANDVFDPQDPALTADDLRARIDRPVDEIRWDPAVARLHAALPELF